MKDWFATENPAGTSAAVSIEGLRYLPNYLSAREEGELLSQIDSMPTWSNDLRRRVQHYGYRYDYRSRAIDASMTATPFPDWLNRLALEVSTNGLMSGVPDQAIINEYLPGQGIAQHVDCEPCFGPEVVSLSLGSGCEMKFVHVDDHQEAALYLDGASALVLCGSARYAWTHGIPARRSDRRSGRAVPRTRRVSVTFRRVILDTTHPDFRSKSRSRSDLQRV